MDELFEIWIGDEWEEAELSRRSATGKTLYFIDPFNEDAEVSRKAVHEGVTWRVKDKFYQEDEPAPAYRLYHQHQCPGCQAYDPQGYSGARSPATLAADLQAAAEGEAIRFGICCATDPCQNLEHLDEGPCPDYLSVPVPAKKAVRPPSMEGWDAYSR